MTATERHLIVAEFAYSGIWNQSDLTPSAKRIAAYNAAFDAVKEAGGTSQEAMEAADHARDQARRQYPEAFAA